MAKPPKSLKGSLLLDGGNLAGSFFHRAVVLVCQHDSEGAFGLVLNQLSGTTAGQALPGEVPRGLVDLPLHVGGPVEPGALSFLHADPLLPEGNVIPGIQLSHSLDSLFELAGTESLTRRLRVFAGYAGWGAGQLDSEMRRKAWVTHAATPDLVFSEPASTLWRRIIAKKGWV